MKSFIGNLLFIGVLLLIATRFMSVMSGTFFPIDIVSSNSMSPILMEGDLVAWTPGEIKDVKVGDVIVFKSWISWPDERLVVHRVVEIHDSWGKPALTTKGDANRYTDQAGPHIPEPYVTEKNFIGKAISIGNQPLKVPFVGIIGIWINEGFKSLSQPSQAKGTYTSIGIFTPLTISVILLIISLFVLPEREKEKSIKEKIQHYIFGTKQLSVKSTFLFFFIIFISFLCLIHLFAYDSISSSVGVGEFPESTSLELGSVSPGRTGFARYLPIINPGVMPVKGMIFGGGVMSPFVDRKAFDLEQGGFMDAEITATVPNGTINGSYVGTILVYSSPIWLIFPNDFIQVLCEYNAELSVFLLDFLASVILTFFTVFTIVSTAYIGNKYRIWEIDISWHFAPKLILKKGIGHRISSFKYKVRKKLGDRFGWIRFVDLTDIDSKSLLLSTSVIIPLLLLLNSEILAMLIASLISGLIAYYFSCMLRKKIVIISSLTMIFTISLLIIKTNYLLITSQRSLVESMALGLGAMGTYFMILALLLIPITIISWYITHKIRNLKEQKEPLLMLEGSCDL